VPTHAYCISPQDGWPRSPHHRMGPQDGPPLLVRRVADCEPLPCCLVSIAAATTIPFSALTPAAVGVAVKLTSIGSAAEPVAILSASRADMPRRARRRAAAKSSSAAATAARPLSWPREASSSSLPSCQLPDLPDDCLRLVCMALGEECFPHPLFRVCRRLRSASFDAVTRVSLYEEGYACVNGDEYDANTGIDSVEDVGRFLLGCRNLRTLRIRSLYEIEDELTTRETPTVRFGAALGECLPYLPLHTLHADSAALASVSARSVSATPLRELHLELEGEPKEQEEQVEPALEPLKTHAATLQVLGVTTEESFAPGFEAAVRQVASLPRLRRLVLSCTMSAQLMSALCVACPAVTTLDLTGSFCRGALSALALPALPSLSDVQIPFTGPDDITHREWISELASMLHDRVLDHLFLMSTAEDEDEEDPAEVIAAVSQLAQLPRALRYYTNEDQGIASSAGLDDECLARLVAAPGAATTLRSLSIELYEDVTVAGMEMLGKLASLQRLHLRAPFFPEDVLQPWVITQVSELKVTCYDPLSMEDVVTALGAAAPALTRLTHLKMHASEPLPPSAAAGLGALSLRTFDFLWFPAREDPIPLTMRAATRKMRVWAARLWRGNVATIRCPEF